MSIESTIEILFAAHHLFHFTPLLSHYFLIYKQIDFSAFSNPSFQSTFPIHILYIFLQIRRKIRIQIYGSAYRSILDHSFRIRWWKRCNRNGYRKIISVASSRFHPVAQSRVHATEYGIQYIYVDIVGGKTTKISKDDRRSWAFIVRCISVKSYHTVYV